MINGNTEGIKASILAEMENIYEIETDRDEFISLSLIYALADFTGRLGREISVYLDRNGDVVDVSVGDSESAPLREMSNRRSGRRLTGLRCIHTHPNGDAVLSDVDLHSLTTMRFDSMASLGVKEGGKASAIMASFPEPDAVGGLRARVEPLCGIYGIPQKEWMALILDIDARVGRGAALEKQTDRAILVGLEREDSESMKELKSLADTAGIEFAGFSCQSRPSPDPATYVGKGKARELSLESQAADANVLIFNDELSPAQVRNLEEQTGCRVVDRNTLILDIFAQRARSSEGRLQVELAQLKYNSSRLTGFGVAMSRLGGGIGTRGPGETKLETDRRHIRARIAQIEKEIAAVEKRRATQRSRRERNQVPVAALVGYTNSGKSTLLNALSGADVFVQDALFATLDTTTRQVELPGGGVCLVIDTVGFISKLPHVLIEAFKSTLEEALYADLLVVVQDMANAHAAEQLAVVDEVLSELGAGDRPRILALNKCDREGFAAGAPVKGGVTISAKMGTGLDNLLAEMEKKLFASRVEVKATVPYARGDVLAYIHKNCIVRSESYEADGTLIEFAADPADAGRVRKLLGGRE